MERGNSKHGPREDDALSAELAGQLGQGSSNREEWTDPEPPADDDAPSRTDLPAPDGRESQDEVEMQQLRHDMSVADDWHPADD